MDNLKSGDRLGGFELLGELGRGGMGVVFKARDVSLDRDVALKVLLPALSSDEHYVRRFQREARAIAALRHPNIVSILSSGEAEGRHYFAMEYVTGRDLGRVLKERKTLPVGEALSITRQIAKALGAANARGITHRDVKPSNIMIDEAGNALIADFGIARLLDSREELTQAGTVLGTPEFVSPEQARGDPVDVRSDIYSLGAVLYRMASGKLPVTGTSPLAIMARISAEPVTPLAELSPSIPKPVCILVDRMMARQPENRPQTPEDLLAAIDECERGLGVGVSPTAATVFRGEGAQRAGSGRSRAIAVGSVLGAALAVLLLVWSVEGGPLGESDVTIPEQPPDLSDLQELAAEPIALAPVAAPPPPSLPRRPAVLVVVSGDEPMLPLVRAELEAALLGSGLDVIPVAEVPLLREKMRLGRSTVSWYDVQQLVPAGRAQIVVLAQVQKTGSRVLRYYGRVDEMTVASFTVQTIDARSGKSIHAGSAGSIEFTSLNMDQNLRDAVGPVADGVGAKIEQHWERERSAAARSDRG